MAKMKVTIKETGSRKKTWVSTHEAESRGDAMHKAIHHHFGERHFLVRNNGLEGLFGQIGHHIDHGTISTDTGNVHIAIDEA